LRALIAADIEANPRPVRLPSAAPAQRLLY
jgi:hypothetical protein